MPQVIVRNHHQLLQRISHYDTPSVTVAATVLNSNSLCISEA
jgi:hypothetical protein